MSAGKIKELTVSTLKNWRNNNSITDIAVLSFCLLLSLPAILLFSVSVGNLFLGSGQVQDTIVEYMEGIVAATLIEALKAFIENMPETGSLSLSALAGLILLMLGAGNVFRQFNKFLDRIWKVPVSKGNADNEIRICAVIAQQFRYIGLTFRITTVREHYRSYEGTAIKFIKHPELDTSIQTSIINKDLVIETNVQVLVHRIHGETCFRFVQESSIGCALNLLRKNLVN